MEMPEGSTRISSVLGLILYPSPHHRPSPPQSAPPTLPLLPLLLNLPAWQILQLNGLLAGPTFGATKQEGHPPTTSCTLWACPTSCLSLSILSSLCLCLPLPCLSSSHLQLHCLSLLRSYLPLLSQPPWPTLHLLLPCLSSLNLSP